MSAIKPGDWLGYFAECDFSAVGEGGVWGIEDNGPGVVVIHELPGMTWQCLRLAKSIADSGFSVYLPLLFGEPGKRLGGLRQLCIMREWNALAKRDDTQTAGWVRDVGREVHRRCGGLGIGAIGMCLTGGFIIPLLLDDHLLAPVASQPSLPWALRDRKTRHSLGFDRDLPGASRRVKDENLGVLAFRFAGDRICPPAKFRGLQEAFGDRLEKYVFKGRKHSVLTKHYRPDQPLHRPGPGQPKTLDAVAKTIAFLERALKSES